MDAQNHRIIVVTGLSGSGKSIALNALEDSGFYCMDNLPVCLFETFVELICKGKQEASGLTAIGIDARTQGAAIAKVPKLVKQLEEHGIETEILFLDADDNILIKRFSETRRRHPLTKDEHSLDHAIGLERELLEPLQLSAAVTIDTSHTSVHDLRRSVSDHIADKAVGRMSVVITSFGFKRGVPRNADFVFDARCLPNPHWEPALRPLTGKDNAVADFLSGQQKVQDMMTQIIEFLDYWAPCFEHEGRSYLTVAIGCTGGQHRSVFLTENIYKHMLEQDFAVKLNHRELA